MLGQPGDADVVGLVMLGQFGMFGGHPVGQAGELTVDCGQLFFGGTSLCARHRRRRWPLGRCWGANAGSQLQVFVDAAGQVPQPVIENRLLLVSDPLEQIPVV